MAAATTYAKSIPDWRKSTAFVEMTLKEQGAYWNLLDECYLRGGYIPNDDRILQRACGDPLEWADVKDKVLRWFRLEQTGWTHDRVLEEIGTLSVVEDDRERKRLQQRDRRLQRRHESGFRAATNEASRRLHPPLQPPLVNSTLSCQCREAIALYNTVFHARISETPGNLKAAERSLSQGYTLEQFRTVFEAIRDQSTETARWCATHNREFEYLIRPPYKHHRTHEITQGPLDRILNELATGRGKKP